MAKSKTGSFWLTERVNMATMGTLASGEIDLGAYVDVGDQQALSIETVDFIFQGVDTNGDPELIRDAVDRAEFGVQLTDLNPGGALLVAEDNSLRASGTLMFDGVAGAAGLSPSASTGSDFYPDNFGKLDESRMVVNDTLFISAIGSGLYQAGETAEVTVRVKARIVKLGTKDWMAIAIQSTASDN